MSAADQVRVLIIDDEPQIRRVLGIALRAQALAVSEAGTAREGLDAFARDGADLVILDLGLPDVDGIHVLRELRAASNVPVIVVSVRAAEAQVVAALDAGANDYVTKPFGVQVLSARIRACLRARIATALSEPFDDGVVHIDPARRRVERDGKPLAPTRKEWMLLALLLRHRGRVVSQAQILRELWGPTHEQDTHYLRILVAKLRARLGDDAAAPRYIGTEPGVGLRFLDGAE